MTAAPAPARRLVTVSSGLRQPSSTRLLADRMTAAALGALAREGLEVESSTVELRDHARDLTTMLVTGLPTPAVDAMLDLVTGADALVVVTPIYSGSFPGMFKDLVDLVPDGALAGVPVLMGATAGTARHALALEHSVRPLLSYLRSLVVPTGVFAATEDFGEPSAVTPDATPLVERLDRGATELAQLVASRAARVVTDPFAVPDLATLLRGRGDPPPAGR